MKETSVPRMTPIASLPGCYNLNETARYFLQHNSAEIKEELLAARAYQSVEKDILIVVHDQLECLVDCINSISVSTEHYNIYIWDNASQNETASYLQILSLKDNIHVFRHEENFGFIAPNNRLAALGSSPYIILLNSDTVVRKGWDETMIAWLQQHPDIGAVGCMGGLLDKWMVGQKISAGYNVDYVCGWGLCFPREVYDTFGLFDEENIKFAYGEDSDFSMRLKEGGKKIYAMYADLVLHLGARTAVSVSEERDMTDTFTNNHQYLYKRWQHMPRLGAQGEVLPPNPS